MRTIEEIERLLEEEHDDASAIAEEVPGLISLIRMLSAVILRYHETHEHRGDCPAGGQITIHGDEAP